MTYFVKLTEGNSSGNYNIYYNNITPGTSNLMKIVPTDDWAEDISLDDLLNGVTVSAPVIPTKIIVYGVECNNAIEFPIKSTEPKNVPPIYCVTYFQDNQKILQFIPDSTLYNGETQWSSVSGGYKIVWNPYFNGGRGRWEIRINSGLVIVNDLKTNGLPSGNWSFVGFVDGYTTEQLNQSLVVNEGICLPTQTLSCSLVSTPNSCFKSKTYDGTITVSTVGGTSPLSYNLDNVITQFWPTFTQVAPGEHSVIVTDADGNQTTCSTIVGEGGEQITYKLYIDYTTNNLYANDTTISKRGNFNLVIGPEIPVGTTITLTIRFNDTQTISSPGNGTITNNIEIYKNDILIPLGSTISRVVNNVRENCSSYFEQVRTISKTYTFSITNGDIIKGTSTSTLNLTSGQVDQTTQCATELKDRLDVIIDNPTANCGCCNITLVDGTPLTVIDNSIIANTKANPTTRTQVELSYSPAGCDVACSETVLLYYTNVVTLTPGCEIFTDATGTNKPQAGYYSDYTNCYYFDGNTIRQTYLCGTIGPPPSTNNGFYKAEIYRCSPENCSTVIDTVVVTVDSNYRLNINQYYRDLNYTNYTYFIVSDRATGPASYVMAPSSESTSCVASCAFVPPS